MKKILLFFFLPSMMMRAYAQSPDPSNYIIPIHLDEVVIKAAHRGFDVNAFIRRVQTDTTFYKAFRSYKLKPNTALNDIEVLGTGNQIIASMRSHTRQTVNGRCRVTHVTDQHTTGHFYKRNGKYNYYTVELFAYLFWAMKPECNLNDIVAGGMTEQGSSRIEKSKYELKQLIFNPGAKVEGIPFMGDKAAIFAPSQEARYQFSITSGTFERQPCYIFEVKPKSGQEGQVVYNELTTWFRKSDYAIVARNYSLSFHTMLYDFDVHMKVRTTQIGGKLYPVHIEYNGNWHVFSKKRERVRFTTDIDYSS